jgi:cytosine/adenosine deaminase-related metal-dependent hydrolase
VICYHARWVLPISASPIENGTVGVQDGRIAHVGPRAQAPHASRNVDLGDAVLMPGLVNVHTHLELTAMRGFLEDLDFARWIMRLNAVKRAVLDRESMLDAARLGVIEGLRHGVTTFADTCDSGVAFDAMLDMGVRGIMYQEVFGPDPAACGRALTELRDKVVALRARETQLVRVGVSPHAPYTVSDALFAAVALLAASERLPIAVHIAESREEARFVEQAEGVFADGLRARGIDVTVRGSSSIELLESTGVLSARPLLIHCVRVSPEDVARIAASRSSVAHCPISNAKLGHGVAPLLQLLESDIPVGLGSDSVASNNRMDMLAEARAAALAQRARAARHDVLGAREVLHLATLGGARAIGLDGDIGSIEVGKAADLTAFALKPDATPVHDPEAAVVFALPGTSATLVIVAGRELVRDGQVLADDPRLTQRVDETAARMRQWLAQQSSGS